MLPDLNQGLRKLSNPFIKLTPDEKLIFKEKELSVKKDIKELAQLAKELYGDKRYQKLREIFKQSYDNTVELLLLCPDLKDKEDFTWKVYKYLTELKVLKLIVETPDSFIKQEEKINKEEALNKK